MSDSIQSAQEALTAAIRADIVSRITAAIEPTAVAAKATVARPLAARRAKGEKRSPVELRALTAKLLSAIRTEPGSRIEYLAKQIDISTTALALPTKKLIASGAVKTKGQRRGTTYYPGNVRTHQ